jgi:hypothetical protein
MEYKIVFCHSLLGATKAIEKLVKAVNEAISLGWEPLGGVSLTGEGTAAQAMIKRR